MDRLTYTVVVNRKKCAIFVRKYCAKIDENRAKAFENRIKKKKTSDRSIASSNYLSRLSRTRHTRTFLRLDKIIYSRIFFYLFFISIFITARINPANYNKSKQSIWAKQQRASSYSRDLSLNYPIRVERVSRREQTNALKCVCARGNLGETYNVNKNKKFDGTSINLTVDTLKQAIEINLKFCHALAPYGRRFIFSPAFRKTYYLPRLNRTSGWVD